MTKKSPSKLSGSAQIHSTSNTQMSALLSVESKNRALPHSYIYDARFIPAEKAIYQNFGGQAHTHKISIDQAIQILNRP